MIANNFSVYGIRILVELMRDILYFPVWWYSRGLFNFLLALVEFLSNKQKSLALLVWIKNIFRPMYGQHDWVGILISFFIRLLQIIARSMVMLFWLIFAVAVFLIWIVSPVFVIYEIIFQIAL